MEATLRIHRYDRSELEALLEIERDAGDSAWTRSQFLSNLRRPISFCRVIKAADAREEVVGFIVLDRRPKCLYLANMAIGTAWRRKGCASWGLERVEEIARERGLLHIALDVKENNLPAQLLYRKAGFKAVAIRHGYYGSQDGYHMRKVLAGSGKQ